MRVRDFSWLGGAAALFAANLAAAQSADLGRWLLGPPLPTPRSEVAVAATGGVLYVIGGYANGDVDQPLVEAFDPRTGRWRAGAPLPRGLNHVGVAALGGKIYAIGGFQRQNRDAVADCFAYDPPRDRWRKVAPLPTKRGSVSVAALGGKIHAVAGRDRESVTTHDVYDPATNRWTSAAPLPSGEGRDHMGLLSYGGKLYAIGGRFNDFYHNTNLAEVYDPADDRWTELPRLPTARSGGAAAVYDDRLLYIGGERAGGVFTENEAFDPQSEKWSQLAPLPSGRHGTGAAVIGDELYVPAGAPVNGGSRQSDTLLIFVIGQG
jgi:N-acetylneuraminic acid mutarotase